MAYLRWNAEMETSTPQMSEGGKSFWLTKRLQGCSLIFSQISTTDSKEWHRVFSWMIIGTALACRVVSVEMEQIGDVCDQDDLTNQKALSAPATRRGSAHPLFLCWSISPSDCGEFPLFCLKSMLSLKMKESVNYTQGKSNSLLNLNNYYN